MQELTCDNMNVKNELFSEALCFRVTGPESVLSCDISADDTSEKITNTISLH